VQTANLKAIGRMLCGVVLFSFMDAGLKALSGAYPAMQVAALRAGASLPFLLLAIAWTRGWRELRVNQLPIYVVRIVLGVIMIGSFIYSVSRQGLTDSYAVFMSAPLMVAVLCHFVLKETVPWRRWLVIVVGFSGVLIALKPRGGGLVSLGGLAAALSAVCYALSVVSIRALGRAESSRTLVFWNLVGILLIAGACALPNWQPIRAEHLWILAVIGLTGAIAQYCLTAAFQLAPPAIVAPFEYTALIWGLGLDFLLFDIRPVHTVLLGGAVVIASGLYLMWDERRPIPVA
jgi:drug/metabolite transporter (DMT)-like permease